MKCTSCDISCITRVLCLSLPVCHVFSRVCVMSRTCIHPSVPSGVYHVLQKTSKKNFCDLANWKMKNNRLASINSYWNSMFWMDLVPKECKFPWKQWDFSSVHLKQKRRIFARGYPGDGKIGQFNTRVYTWKCPKFTIFLNLLKKRHDIHNVHNALKTARFRCFPLHSVPSAGQN